ncbi:NAD(P)-binding domain-containing protein [Roseomonas gilardii]|uniref:NAD(P)-binding domain-containing protein n=1 Tax=Roseomonas gilardii TaxID=257708 RepID=UPI001C92E884|nr:NAD(P)/FAD-dependent oxidoreductase [Roseomonas gilardii]
MMPDDVVTADPLFALAQQARRDLDRISHPARPWVPPCTGPDGQPVLDVMIVGAGQSGLATGFGLMRAQVTNILLVDKAPRGLEGPWLTYARMPTLRSPKEYTGPDLDIPSLTYQSWHEARYGAADWAQLFRISRQDWAEYLLWLRDTVGVPVRNGVSVTDIAPAASGTLLAVTLTDGEGHSEIRHARRVVLATGQDSLGRWSMPDFVEALPPHLRAHTADPIDFAALRDRTVAVLGVGASAMDNAAMALEAGAKEVHVFCRRPELQLVQPYLWLTFSGFLRHLSDMEDPWRWRMMRYILGLREGFPQPTWERCAKHRNFVLHTGAPWLNARPVAEGVEIGTPQGPFQADFVICGTGIEIDPPCRPELRYCADNIASWGDRYVPPEDERDSRLSRFPYLGRDYALQERTEGQTPWIRRLHLFSIASTVSFGASGSSINAMNIAVPKLVSGLTEALFREDLEQHWASLQGWDVRQAEIRWPVGG